MPGTEYGDPRWQVRYLLFIAGMGGLLYGILKGWEPARWGEFAWACGALVTTLETDYAHPADEEQVWSIWKGNARVRR